MAAIKGNGPSYEVLSKDYVYRGFPALKGIAQLDPSIIKSSRSKYKMGTFSFGYNKNPLYNPDGDNVVFRTSGNVFETAKADFEKYGNFFGRDDFEIEGWLAAGEKAYPNIFNEVSYLPDLVRQSGHFHPEGLWLGVPLRMYFPNKGDTPVNLYTRSTWFNVPINKFGVNLSKVANAENYIKNAILDVREMRRGDFNPEIAAWLDYISKKGFKNPGKLIEIGVEKGNFYAATYPGKYITLVFPEDFEEKIQGIMEQYDLHGERAKQLAIDQIIFHEIHHFFPKGYEGYSLFRRYIEHRAGKLQADFYGKRAKLLEGKDIAKIYKVLEQIDSDYAKSWSFWRALKKGLLGYKKNGLSNRESLESRLEADAAALGLKGDEIANYVSMMMADYEAREALEESSKPARSERKGNLESKVESLSRSAKSKGKGSREKGKEAAIYDKMQVYEGKEVEETKEESGAEDSEAKGDDNSQASDSEEGGESSEASSE